MTGTLPEVGEAQLRGVLDSIPARVALLDRARRHRYVNGEYARFLGRERAEILGRTVAEVIGAPAFEMVRQAGERALDGETVRWEGWLPYADGRSRYVERVYRPHHGPSGSIDGYLVFSRDLTELKRSQEELARQVEALHASEALNAAITASALDCIVVIDESGRVVEFNQAAERTFGYRRADALGRPIAELIVPEALRRRHADGFARYLRTGQARLLGRRVEMEAMRADASLFPVELTIVEVRVPGRRLFTATLRDLTAQRQAAAELAHNRETMHQNEKMAAFGSLLAGVAHELNNPLSIVIGHALMLHADAAEAEANAGLAARAETIQLAAERCARIVRAFLDMARQRKLSRCPFALGPVIDGALELLAYGLRSGGVEVVLHRPAAPCHAVGDPDQVSQVLTNLLLNAQQALEDIPGPRRITVELTEDRDRVLLRVADNGPGVPEAIRGRIFDPFFTTKPTGAGTGIGLAVSRGIAEAHGGSLTLLPGGAGGSCFELSLPRSESQAAEHAAVEPPERSPAQRAVALIVDDEPEVASVLAHMLGQAGFRCDIAKDGQAAQALMTGQEYDAVLCDLHMPGMDGAALFDWMAAHRPELCPRTAFVTGDTLGRAAGSFLARAGQPVLEKPFTPDDVRRVVRSVQRWPG